MSDDAVRLTARAAALSGAADDEARALRTRVRSGEAIYDRDLPLLKVTEGARASVMETLRHARIPEEERGLLFVRGLRGQYASARSRLEDLHIIEPDEIQGVVDLARTRIVSLLGPDTLDQQDVEPPTAEEAIDIVLGHLEENSDHLEAIRNMRHPVLQLEPVYGYPAAGFVHIVSAVDHAQPDPDHEAPYVHSDLIQRWGLTDAAHGERTIVGWNIAVTEGEPNLPEAPGARTDAFGVQLAKWEEANRQKGLHLPNNVRYALLPKLVSREGQSARVDSQTFAILEDLSHDSRSRVMTGRSENWRELVMGVRDATDSLGPQLAYPVFRTTVVIPVPRRPSKAPSGDRFRPSVIAPIES